MTEKEAREVPNGLYIVFWNTDVRNPSYAAVGRSPIGMPWLAPTNWSNFFVTDQEGLIKAWKEVHHVCALECSIGTPGKEYPSHSCSDEEDQPIGNLQRKGSW